VDAPMTLDEAMDPAHAKQLVIKFIKELFSLLNVVSK
jgi:hypothetical protein